MQKFIFLRQKCAFLAPGGSKVAWKWVNAHEIYMAQTCEVYGDLFDDPGGHLSVFTIFSQLAPIVGNSEVVTLDAYCGLSRSSPDFRRG